MLDIVEELRALLAALSERDVEYALCGGLALAVHGVPRATVDIDLLVLADDVDAAVAAARDRGFVVDADSMQLADARVTVRRVSKLGAPGEDPLPLDLVVVTEENRKAWDSRERMAWIDGDLTVVSVDGLVHLKRLRSSRQDIADIERLQDLTDED